MALGINTFATRDPPVGHVRSNKTSTLFRDKKYLNANYNSFLIDSSKNVLKPAIVCLYSLSLPLCTIVGTWRTYFLEEAPPPDTHMHWQVSTENMLFV
jgi:hypothetical protein